MSLPIFSSVVPGTNNGNYCTLIVPFPLIPNQASGQNTAAMIDVASYLVVAGTGVSAATVTFQELGTDQTWRALASPAPLSIVFATAPNYNGILNGPFHGLRMVVSSLSGGSLTYAELKASVRGM